MIRSFASTGNRCAWFHFSEDISTPRQRRQHTMDGVIASPSTSCVTARRYASAVLDMGLCLSVCVSLSLCLSVTNRSSVETDKRIDTVFTARCYASAVLAMGLCLCLSVSVCLSVTSRSSTKTAKRRITQTTPHDSPGTLVF